MRKKILIPGLIIVVFAIVAFTAFLINKSNKDAVYILGCEYIQNGDYEAAYEAFTTIENYKDVPELLNEIQYQLGVAAFEADDMEAALKYFDEITEHNSVEFEASKEYYLEIYYKALLASIESRDLDKAEDYVRQILSEVSEYKDVAYQSQVIIYERYMNALDENDIEKAINLKADITEEALKQKADRVYEYCEHGYKIVQDLYDRAAAEGAKIVIKEIRCYQYSYNNNVEVPVYMFYTDYTDSAGNSGPRYVAYLDNTYYGFCNTIVRSELDMQDEAQLYAFLKIGPYWDGESTLKLSTGLMVALNSPEN